MILFDTSVWINHFNRNDNQESSHLARLLKFAPASICITTTILQEVLQGAKNDSYFDIYRGILSNRNILKMDAVEAAISAAQLYRSLRKKGVTIRRPDDCLIAAYAIHFGVELCHNDSDFDLIAAHSDLKIWTP